MKQFGGHRSLKSGNIATGHWDGLGMDHVVPWEDFLSVNALKRSIWRHFGDPAPDGFFWEIDSAIFFYIHRIVRKA